MDNSSVDYVLPVSPREARDGVKAVVTIKGRRLEVSIPAGVKTGTIVKLRNVGLTGDTVSVRIDIVIPVVPTYSKSRFPAWWKGAIGLGSVIALIVIGLLSSNTTQQTLTENPRYVYQNGARHVGADGQPIELTNNPDATNPTYAELVAFIKEDTTDQLAYVEGFNKGEDIWGGRVCADFAESVHNNAEAKGIKAAWVGIDFVNDENGHAVNAFLTTDKGLVFVDCTGRNTPVPSDKIAYVEEGKPYGAIMLDYADLVSYSFYEKYTQDWQHREELEALYNQDVSSYNQAIAGKKYTIGSPAYKQMQAWKSRLDAQRQVIDDFTKELGDTFPKPMGIVSNIFIRW